YFSKTLIVTDEEKEDFMSFLDQESVNKTEVLHYGVDTGYFKRTQTPDSGPVFPSLIFHGTMNVDAEAALLDLVRIFDAVRKKYPDVQLFLVGNNPTDEIKESVKDREGIQLTGYVEDIRPYLEKAAVGVYPMRIGTGIKNRVLEAMAMGLPVVTTPMGAYGIKARNNENVMINNDIASLTDGVLTLLSNQDLREKMGREARKTMETDYTWKNILADFNRLIN
ncbi:MAG: glycosyltransferase, partial [bacterium]|nr:glycosyltransferase [bacterium]